MRNVLSITLLAAIAASAQAQLVLPFAGTDPSATISSFQIIKSGSAGRANTLYISNASNTSDVLLVNTVGLGRAAYFSINNPANNQMAVRGESNGTGIGVFGFMTGTGKAGSFRIINATNTSPALHAQTNGVGPAFMAQAGTGNAAEFSGSVTVNSSQTFALTVESTGTAIKGISTGDGNALAGDMLGLGRAGRFRNLNAFNPNSALFVETLGTGPSLSVQAGGGPAIEVIGGSIEVSTGAFNGVKVQNSNVDARTVFAHATSTFDLVTYGVFAISDAPRGVGLFGSAFSSTGVNTGVKGQTLSADGRGVLGVALSATGNTFGGRFENSSSAGTGVLGFSSASTGTTSGGRFQADSSSGRGVFGTATSGTGTTYGGRFQNFSSGGFALFADGKSGASGTKSFRIDHPFNPENEYLLHYSTEMPEPQNAYNGTVVTNANGEAWVQLPDYFCEINRDFKYQLTVVDNTDSDQFAMAKIAREIQDNRFKIRTSQPRVKVSWEVKAIRNDLWVRKFGAPTEMQKVGEEKGRYQHPELYGKPKELGMNYRAEDIRALSGKNSESKVRSMPVRK